MSAGGWRDVTDLTADGSEVQIHLGEQDGPARLELYRKIMPLAVAKFEAAGRAAGWREAIEALRDTDAVIVWVKASDGNLPESIATYLESLAPKETPVISAEQCPARSHCPKCRCVLDAGHDGSCDIHCGGETDQP